MLEILRRTTIFWKKVYAIKTNVWIIAKLNAYKSSRLRSLFAHNNVKTHLHYGHTTVSRSSSAAHPLHMNVTVALPRTRQPLNITVCCNRMPISTAMTYGNTAHKGGAGSDTAMSTGDEIALSVKTTTSANPLTSANCVSR